MRVTLDGLCDLKRWVAWRQETRDGELTKMPKNPATGGNAEVPTGPSTYGTRAAAEQRWQKLKRQDVVGGIGIVLGKLDNGDWLNGIDLDSCRDPNTGKIADWAKQVIERFKTYAEVSPSGSGVKLYFLLSTPDMEELHTLLGVNEDGKQRTRKTFAAAKHREVALDIARFYAVTGERFGGSKSLRRVEFSDVEWFLIEVGPAYLAQERQGNGHAKNDPYSTLGPDWDESGSGYGYRFMMDRRAEGMSYQDAREAILA